MKPTMYLDENEYNNTYMLHEHNHLIAQADATVGRVTDSWIELIVTNEKFYKQPFFYPLMVEKPASWDFIKAKDIYVWEGTEYIKANLYFHHLYMID